MGITRMAVITCREVRMVELTSNINYIGSNIMNQGVVLKRLLYVKLD
jgi:hypothetical protein